MCMLVVDSVSILLEGRSAGGRAGKKASQAGAHECTGIKILIGFSFLLFFAS